MGVVSFNILKYKLFNIRPFVTSESVAVHDGEYTASYSVYFTQKVPTQVYV